MTDRIQIEDARKFGMHSIVANGVDGSAWMLRHSFPKDDIKLLDTLKKVRAAKSIDARFWKRLPRDP